VDSVQTIADSGLTIRFLGADLALIVEVAMHDSSAAVCLGLAWQ
jgi:hypothetical protein